MVFHNNNNNNESLFHQKILHILCYNNTEDKKTMIKISTYTYIYIKKKVCHYLFTKVFIKRAVLIFRRAQPFFLRLCT